MRSEQVQTHLRCNQSCSYCTVRRPTDAAAWVREPAVEQRIREAIAGGAREIVLSGGEPTQRGDLARLVATARGAGAERVTLETNATLLDDARARELAAAGLDRALVNLAGDGPWLDAVTRDPGGWDATVRGVHALIGAGVRVDVQAAIVRSTAARIAELPGMLVERFGGAVRTLFLVVPVRSPDASELLDYDTAGAILSGSATRRALSSTARIAAPAVS